MKVTGPQRYVRYDIDKKNDAERKRGFDLALSDIFQALEDGFIDNNIRQLITALTS